MLFAAAPLEPMLMHFSSFNILCANKKAVWASFANTEDSKSDRFGRKPDIRILTEEFNFWSVLVILTVSIIVYHVGAVIFGAPLLESFQSTLYFSVLMTIFTAYPLLWYFFFTDSITAVLKLLSESKFDSLTENQLHIIIIGTVLGAWIGAIPIPLDWDRPWQTWPITCCIGASIGNSGWKRSFKVFQLPFKSSSPNGWKSSITCLLSTTPTMVEIPTVWVENSADSLLDLTVRYCIKYPRTFCQFNVHEPGYQLRDGLSLPQEICEHLLTVIKDELTDDYQFDSLIKVFKDVSRTRLRRVDLSNSHITDRDLAILSNHSITELNISGCKRLTRGALYSVSKLFNRLQSLNIGTSSHIFQDDRSSSKGTQINDDDHLLQHCMGLIQWNVDAGVPSIYEQGTPSSLELPNLRKLSIFDFSKPETNSCFMSLLRSAKSLTFLDLSRCELQGDLNGLMAQKHLTSLILCDVSNVRDLITAVCQIKTLRHLDLSNTGEDVLLYDNPNQVLKTIVNNLPELVSLDISGTNLAGGRTQESSSSKKGNSSLVEGGLTDIPGLASRVNRPLEFLGLLNCAHDACYRHHIPAKKIAGDASEEQILTAGQAYCSREPMIQKVLNDLFQIFRFSSCENTKLALDVVMEAMKQHLKVKHIQVSGSASLFYIVKGEHKELFNIKIRRKIIKTLIDAMFLHYSDVTMLRNGCLTLIHFKIPEDVFFDYERLASLLLLIVAQEEQDEFVQRIGVYLLNSLACQVDGIEKKLVGDQGAITIMLQVIERRLVRGVCDEVMETAWSTMWNVTDETPINCARFLEGKGMDLFLGCLDAFPLKPDLLRNMMGLLGNVAEVKELRSYLMKDEYLTVFNKLLSSKSDGIEVSYNAAGILSHIASDGPEPWANVTALEREDVLNEMVNSIERWNLNTKRNINYRSFKPILRLLTVDHTPEAQHWAAWALANLTKVYPEKYCSLLKEEGGIELLNDILRNPSNPRIYELANMSIQNCLGFNSANTTSNEAYDDDDALDVT
ncbi:hypothetical protein JTE90_002858 [Oedothorax gibbosus]|uniref:Protein zer-1 homolog n=1 Tax=Oedothorax gibbosus TaxID=931172 RepID=A0AAV6TUX4_9ARAC|nr:hypothetical protein JTE90_002858 [Oedothorax gibbosus]